MLKPGHLLLSLMGVPQIDVDRIGATVDPHAHGFVLSKSISPEFRFAHPGYLLGARPRFTRNALERKTCFLLQCL